MAWQGRGGGNWNRGGGGGWNRGGGGGYQGGGRGGYQNQGGQGGGRRNNNPLIRLTGLFEGSKPNVFSGTVSVQELGDFISMLRAQIDAGEGGGVRFILYANDRQGPTFTLHAVGTAEGPGSGYQQPQEPVRPQQQAPQINQDNWGPAPAQTTSQGQAIAGPDQGIQPQGGRANGPLF